MDFSGHICPNDTIGYFRIAAADGRQPVEPVAVGQFLIGSGPSCQIRLGSSNIPEVHTMLAVEPDQVSLSAKASEPTVFVNGCAVRECKLQDGDLLEIGDHTMLFRRVGAEERITLDETEFTEASGISAEEIVDRLDDQMHLVEELGRTSNDGIVELLTAVAQTAVERHTPIQHGGDRQGSGELQQVLSLLQKHHEASRIRLESLTEVLDNVVQQQKLIADTLEVMSRRIQALDTHPGYDSRKSA